MTTTVGKKGAAKTTYPAVGEVFELTLDGDASENNPIEMVRRDGYRPEDWRHKGEKVAGEQTRRFMLVSVGYCHFGELVRRLVKHGTIPGGQWREALKAAYKSDRKGPVGIADASWMCLFDRPFGRTGFPSVHENDCSYFDWAYPNFGFDDGWRWLVEVR